MERFNAWVWNEGRFAYLVLSPVLIILTVLTVYPLVSAVVMSTQLLDYRRPLEFGSFLGLDNYVRLLSSADFWSSLRLTVTFVLVTVSLQTVFGFVIALIAHAARAGRGIVRAAILLPWALPTSINAMVWRWMFNTDYGVINDILLRTGIVEVAIPWLGSGPTAFAAISGTAIWKVSSFMGLLILAGLQGIPDSFYESASVDGANRWQQFWAITVPAVRPALMVALIFRTNDAFRVFDLIYVLTGGGPGGSTRSVAMMAYETNFRDLSFGYGSTLSVVMFLISVIISATYLYFFYLKRGEE